MAFLPRSTSSRRINDHFHYLYSCDLDDVNLKIRIVALEGDPGTRSGLIDPSIRSDLTDLSTRIDLNDLLKRIDLNDPCTSRINPWEEVKISCQLKADGKPWGPSFETSCKQGSGRRGWNEWIVLPFKISDLPRNTELWLECLGVGTKSSLGQTKISIFNKYSCLRKGIYDLKLLERGRVEEDRRIDTSEKDVSSLSEKVVSIEKAMKKYEAGLLKNVDWLDKLTFPAIERMKKEEKEASNQVFLSVEFGRFCMNGTEYTIVYYEKEAEEACQLSFDSDLIIVPDPEMFLDNLVETKHHLLSRNVRTGVHDKDLKPNPQTRDLLNNIVNYPSTTILTSSEQDTVWKYRFYLLNQKKALTKFLKCINWDVPNEAVQAIELMYKWSPMDIEDALELFSPHFRHPAVRSYAVSRLKQAPDEDLLLYLLQLVQALKYESPKDGSSCEGQEFMNPKLKPGEKKLKPGEKKMEPEERKFKPEERKLKPEGNCDLATFLIERCGANDTLANYLFWYLSVELEEHRSTESAPQIRGNSIVYVDVMHRFSQSLLKGNQEEKGRRSTLFRQEKFVEALVKLMKLVAREKGDRTEKTKKLQSLLSENETFNFKSFDSLPLPLDPSVHITGVVPEKAMLFKSALMPGLLTFLTTEGQEYKVIMKYGDDLRQDQLILQTITLIDKLLKKENLDLKLTPYRVLATSSKHGFVQYIDAISVADVLKNHTEIQEFFRYHSATKDGSISSEVIDTYIKSCAGYCIITYLLGVGDRHLDNLLLSKNGNLFHIDFGYILGRDPKPFPPPMKLSREMVEAMGGVKSENYQEFKKLCYTAFLHLRRHANLILNLFTLMVDATIPDVALEPDKAVKKVQDKFRLDLNDEAAVQHINGLLEISTTAVMASLVEGIHRWAQYWRK